MSIKRIVAETGYIFFDEYMKGKTTEELANYLEEKEHFQRLSGVHQLTPKAAIDSTPNTYSGQYGHGEFRVITESGVQGG